MTLYQRRTPETVEAYPAGEAYVIIKDERASVISKEEFVKLYVPFQAGR